MIPLQSFIYLAICSSSLFTIPSTAKIVVLEEGNTDSYYDRLAGFGPRLADSGIEGFLVAAESLPEVKPEGNAVTQTLISLEDEANGSVYPQHGCQIKSRPEWLEKEEKWIALVERGGCSFIDKVRNMQKSGASGVIVGNNEMSSGLITMYSAGDTSDVIVPSTFIMQWSYRDLRFLIRSGGLSEPPADGADMQDDDHPLTIQRLRVAILPSNDFEWPIMDIIVITIIAPAVILAFMYSLWRFRHRRQIMLNQELEEQAGLLTQEELTHLPMKAFDSNNLVPPECETCAICLDDFEQGEEVRLLPECGHTFHCKCIDIWLTSRKRFCPICKSDPYPRDEESDISSEEDAPLIPARTSSVPVALGNNGGGDLYIAIENDEHLLGASQALASSSPRQCILRWFNNSRSNSHASTSESASGNVENTS